MLVETCGTLNLPAAVVSILVSTFVDFLRLLTTDARAKGSVTANGHIVRSLCNFAKWGSL